MAAWHETRPLECLTGGNIGRVASGAWNLPQFVGYPLQFLNEIRPPSLLTESLSNFHANVPVGRVVMKVNAPGCNYHTLHLKPPFGATLTL